MKTSSLVKSYFQQQSDDLLMALGSPAESFSENDFHRIRVTIKRIKALLILLEEIHPKFNRKKNFSPFKIIFRQVGKIRDLQVQHIMVRSYPWNTSLGKFEFELNQQISAEKMKLFQLVNPPLIHDLQKKSSAILSNLDRLDGQAVTRYLKKKEKRIKQLLSPAELKSSGIHELRKDIKELYYLQKMMEPKSKHLVNTDPFQELLGKWHDGRVLLQGLKSFMKSRALAQSDISVFESLKSKIAGSDQQLYQTILRDKAFVVERLA